MGLGLEEQLADTTVAIGNAIVVLFPFPSFAGSSYKCKRTHSFKRCGLDKGIGM